MLLLSKHSKLLVTFQRHSRITVFTFLSLLSIVESEEERGGKRHTLHCCLLIVITIEALHPIYEYQSYGGTSLLVLPLVVEPSNMLQSVM